MRCVFKVLFSIALVAAPASAADNPQTPGGGEASCRFCKWHPLAGQFSCPTSTNLTSRQGDCQMYWHQGVHNCKGPTGALCVGGAPLPPSPALL